VASHCTQAPPPPQYLLVQKRWARPAALASTAYTATIAMSGTTGKVALVASTTALSGAPERSDRRRGLRAGVSLLGSEPHAGAHERHGLCSVLGGCTETTQSG